MPEDMLFSQVSCARVSAIDRREEEKHFFERLLISEKNRRTLFVERIMTVAENVQGARERERENERTLLMNST